MSSEPVIRPATPDDEVGPVVTAAFGDEGERDCRLWSEIASSSLLRGSIVAVDDGLVVGHVGLSLAWLDARRELVEVWVLSPLSVLPERQGAGLGTRLVAAAVDAARDGGAPLLFLEGSPTFYGARGFERGDAHGFVPASVRTPAPAFQVVRYAGHEPWMTGQLIYPDVWWRYDAAGLRDPLLAEIEEQLR